MLYFSDSTAIKNKDPDPGIIMYDVNSTKQTIPFNAKAVQAHHPKVGDKVGFIVLLRMLSDLEIESLRFYSLNSKGI